MKIVVNKEARKLRQQEIVNDILNKAKECAEKGIINFTYYFKDNEDVCSLTINNLVKRKSESTVQCRYRGNYGTHVNYSIQ